MRNATADQAIVAHYLTSGQLPWKTRELRALGQALPRAAEQWFALQAPEAEALAHALRERLWTAAQANKAWELATGWPTLIAGCIAATEVLGIANPDSDRIHYQSPIRTELEAVRQPAVYVLVQGGEPTRVLWADRGAGEPQPIASQSPQAQSCATLAQTLLRHPGHPVWRLREPVGGDSQMAGLLLRLIVDLALPKSLHGDSIGITGTLDPDGNLLPVEGVTDKVNRFISKFHSGPCFVPASNWAELQELRPRAFGDSFKIHQGVMQPSGRLSETVWQRLYPVHSITELLVRFGIVLEHIPATRLFRDIRAQASYVTDWRGIKKRADEIIPLQLQDLDHKPDRNDPLTDLLSRLSPIDMATRFCTPIGGLTNDGDTRGAALSGRPGAGKSMVMRRLLFDLNVGGWQLDGPAILTNARRMRVGETWAHALARQLRPQKWDADQIAEILTGPGMRGGIWLLLDGLDELPLRQRRSVLGALREWPGRFVLAARKLRQTERFAGILRLGIKDLTAEAQKKLLELEQRKDIQDALDAIRKPDWSVGHERRKDAVSWRVREPDPLPPAQQMLTELAMTPLGISLLATTTQPGQLLPEGRAQLLRQGIGHLIEWAESDQRISEEERLIFEGAGVGLIGAAAWSMLRDGRAVLTSEDLRWARTQLHLPPEEYRSVSRVLSASGFVQPIGSGHYEFSHKSFAEYCSAVFLLAQPLLHDDLLSRIGEPGVDEIVLHLCVLSRDLTPWLRRLMTTGDRPLSALSLAIRALAECQVDAVAAEDLSSVLGLRLRLLSWFPGQDLPGDLGRPGSVWEVLGRFSSSLRTRVDSLISACHPEVKRWLEDPPAFQIQRGDYSLKSDYYQEPDWRHGDKDNWKLHREIAEQIYLALRPPVPLRSVLRFRNGKEILVARGQGDWFIELEPFLDSPEPYLREVAEDVWLKAAPLSRRIELLSCLHDYIHGWHPERFKKRREEIIGAVLEGGTPLQQQEALARAAISIVRFGGNSEDSQSLMDARLWSQEDAPIGLAPIRAEVWLKNWDWGWRSGLLGNEDGSALEELYERFLRDENEAARWRALVAIRNLCSGRLTQSHRLNKRNVTANDEEKLALRARQRRVAEARTMLADSDRAVRIEALQFLLDQGEHLSAPELTPFCLSINPQERWVGLAAANKQGQQLQLEYLVELLVEEETNTQQSTPYAERHTPACTPSKLAIERHGKGARDKLLDWARGLYRSKENRQYLYEQLDSRRLGVVARALLTEGYSDRQVPLSELAALLSGDRPEQRLWAANVLAGNHREQERLQLLLTLVHDSDPAIAAHAKRIVEQQERDAQWIQQRQQSAMAAAARLVPVVELDHSLVNGYPDLLGLNRNQEPERREPFAMKSLDSFTSFEALWAALREHPIELESFQTVDYEGKDDRYDHIEHVAELAAHQNLERLRPFTKKIYSLYQPQYRAVCLKDLGHPLVGLFAELILTGEPPAADLLPLVARDEKSAIRVARISKGTLLAAGAINAFIDAAVAGSLGVQSDEDHTSDEPSLFLGTPPVWLPQFEALAGLEGIIRLLQARLPVRTSAVVLKYLDGRLRNSVKDISEAVRSQVLAWARVAAQESKQVIAQLVALHVLAALGEGQDADTWAEILDKGSPEMPELAFRDAVHIIGQHGNVRHVGLLRKLLTRPAARVAVAALTALSAIGTEQEVELFLERVDGMWMLRHRPPPRGFDSMTLPTDARIAAIRGIICHGSRHHALLLAKHLLDEAASRYTGGRRGSLKTVTVIENNGLVITRFIQGGSVGFSVQTGPNEHQYYDFRPLDGSVLEASRQYGRHPEHALLVLGALLTDPGDTSYGINVSGFDESVDEESKIPGLAQEAIAEIIRRTDREEVRRAFVESVLWGGPAAELARAELDRLGGPQKKDIPLLMEHLEEHPDSQEGLALFTELAPIERELVAIWTNHNCPWWPGTPSLSR